MEEKQYSFISFLPETLVGAAVPTAAAATSALFIFAIVCVVVRVIFIRSYFRVTFLFLFFYRFAPSTPPHSFLLAFM